MELASIGVILRILAFLIALTFHEFMHAWTANYLGDPTAKAMGRVSLNPIAHIDFFGTVVLPLMLAFFGAPVFGYAKPVQINPNNFKNYRAGEILTALAGPLANLVLVLVFATFYRLLPEGRDLFSYFVLQVVVVNIVLMVFNLIPIPPLDGSKLLYGFLSFESMRKLEIYGPYLLLPFIFFLAPSVIIPALVIIMNLLGLPFPSLG